MSSRPPRPDLVQEAVFGPLPVIPDGPGKGPESDAERSERQVAGDHPSDPVEGSERVPTSSRGDHIVRGYN